MKVRAFFTVLLALMVTLSATVFVVSLPASVAGSERERQLTSSPASEMDPAFSPDGKRIAYSSNQSGSFDIWLVDVNGRRQVRLTSMPGDERSPKWSSDGRSIAFLAVAQGRSCIWIVNNDGSGVINLTADNELVGDFEWSPEGRAIAYDSRGHGNWTVSTVDLFGRRNQLTSSGYDSKYPSWSPGGEMIVFSSTRLAKDFNIWMMKADGSGQKRLTTSSAPEVKPRISPKGDEILFLSNRTGEWDVWIIGVEGSEQFRAAGPLSGETGSSPVKLHLGMDSNPNWDSSGERIIFSSAPENSDGDIFIVEPHTYSVEMEQYSYGAVYTVSVPKGVLGRVVGTIVQYGPMVIRISTPFSTKSMAFMDDSNPSYGPDGKKVVFQSNCAGSFDIWLVSFEEKKGIRVGYG